MVDMDLLFTFGSSLPSSLLVAFVKGKLDLSFFGFVPLCPSHQFSPANQLILAEPNPPNQRHLQFAESTDL